jgi:DNA-binding CsgD family transcriptional regulator/PAS domain-containing protein
VDKLLDIIGEIYEAAHQPAHWDNVLRIICAELNAKSAGLFVADHSTSTYDVIGSIGMPELSKMSYRLGLGKYDHAYKVMLEQDEGTAVEIISKDEIMQTNPLYYRLLLKPNNVGYVSGINIFKDVDWHVGLGIHRPAKANQFNDEELNFLNQLYPHLKRSLKIYKKISKLQNEQELMASAMSELLIGIVVIADNGNIKYMNPAAKNIISLSSQIDISDNTLIFNDIEQHNKAKEIIFNLLNTKNKTNSADNVSMTLNSQETTPLDILLSRTSLNKDTSKCITVYITNPENLISVSSSRLNDFYKLTSAEIKLTLALANGMSLQDYSTHHKLSIKTVRAQLKNVFDKTDVNRQQDLVRLILSSPVSQVNCKTNI